MASSPRHSRRALVRAGASALILLTMATACVAGTGVRVAIGPTGSPRRHPAPGVPASPAPVGASATDLLSGSTIRVAGSWILQGFVSEQPAAAARLFDNPSTYLVQGPDTLHVSPPGWRCIYTAHFTSYLAFRTALDTHLLSPQITAVIYDNEHWPGTPQSEQQHPAHYAAMFGRLAHSHGLTFVLAPSDNLLTALGKRRTSSNYRRFIVPLAKYADVFDLQVQWREGKSSTYVHDVRLAAAAARAANPTVRVLAETSTNPAITNSTPLMVLDAIAAGRPYVDGYWLYVDPERGLDFGIYLFQALSGSTAPECRYVLQPTKLKPVTFSSGGLATLSWDPVSHASFYVVAVTVCPQGGSSPGRCSGPSVRHVVTDQTWFVHTFATPGAYVWSVEAFDGCGHSTLATTSPLVMV